MSDHPTPTPAFDGARLRELAEKALHFAHVAAAEAQRTSTANATGLPPAPASVLHAAHTMSEYLAAVRDPSVILSLLTERERLEADARNTARAMAQATHDAVAALYFADSSDYMGGLYDVVKALNPALWMQMEDGVEQRHYVASEAALAALTTEDTGNGR